MMSVRTRLLLFCHCIAVLLSISGTPIFGDDIKVLFLGDRGHHQPARRFADLAPTLQNRGMSIVYTEKVSDLNTDKLSEFDVLVLYANIDAIDKPQADALLDFVAKGGGFVPLHCATYCFRNNPEIVALMGAQFKRHGAGVMRATRADVEHPILKGYGGFESWDETYVHHLHNEKNRTVLEYRIDKEGREPWTWVRTHGDGRVFYTAWGHDSRTFKNAGFHNLVERGIRWAAGQDPKLAGDYLSDLPFPVPKMKSLPKDLKPFDYVDVGKEIPNYTPSREWGKQGEPMNMMQKPLPSKESMKHLVVPEGFHVELFASEPDLQGKPICMAWDERGRLWVGETYDYPNELKRSGKGRDRIRICEDTDNDGRADKFTVFAEELSIPTSIAFSNGGAIVQNGEQTLFLKDTNGDDKADVRSVLLSGWDLGDTHGGVSNFQYGLDNWIWGMQGYNNSAPTADGEKQQTFRMGFFRMKPDGSKVEFIRSTNNNTWGLGISEEGLIFGSTANGCPSVFMPIENRYYERVKGWAKSLTLGSIADSNRFEPITKKVRQVDHHGGYTAGAGHALYTAREYPKEFWNRVAFVNGPTGHLVGSFVLKRNGAGYQSKSPFNLVASDDEWTAPIMSEVGPDGQVWVIDWYNYIVQHNPTPKGFQTGKGRAYVTKLRDKKHGRIYRVVADKSPRKPIIDLSNATGKELVAALKHPTMLIRKHAQRLLVEQQNKGVQNELIALVNDQSADEIGLNVGAIHALWTLKGLGLLDGKDSSVNKAAFKALKHPSAGVRRNALKVLPLTPESTQEAVKAGLHKDADKQVQLAALLAYSDLPSSNESANAILQVATDQSQMSDPWIVDAVTSAAANNSFELLTSVGLKKELPGPAFEIVGRIAEHFVRSPLANQAGKMLAGLQKADQKVVDAILQGVANGWNPDVKMQLSAETEASLEGLLAKLSTSSKGKLVKLAAMWGSSRFEKYQKEIAGALLEKVQDADSPIAERVGAANELVEFLVKEGGVVSDLLDEVSPQSAPELNSGLIQAVGKSLADEMGQALVDKSPELTPDQKKIAIAQLLRRSSGAKALLNGISSNTISLGDLALDQRQALAAHPNEEIRKLAVELMKKGGSLPNADRQKVIEELTYLTKQKGDVDKGKLVFKEHCSKCHKHGQLGEEVGPNLTGMAVHPKEELLVHILDPSRNVEGNFRIYKVGTIDGLLLSGMLSSESKTAIELIDTEGKRKSILREDIEQFSMSNKSVMPEGFEKSIKPEAMKDLLEFLTDKGQYIPIPLDDYATAVSTKALFSHERNGPDQMVFNDWKPKMFKGVPFLLTDPQGATKPNIILLNGPFGPLPPKMPKAVKLPCNTPIKSVHMLGGVGGWNFPYSREKTVSTIVRFEYADGKSEDHELINGIHIADYIRRVDVPKSEFAFQLRGQQLRYLSVSPKRKVVVKSIQFIKGKDTSSPIIMGVTIESIASEKH